MRRFAGDDDDFRLDKSSYMDAQFTADPIYTPPPSVSLEQSWSTPGPTVQRVPEGGGFFDTLFGVVDRAGVSVGKMVDIFGRPVQPRPPVVPMSPPTPVWVYLVIPVALIGVVALMRRKPSGGLGYRRSRRSRRSRR